MASVREFTNPSGTKRWRVQFRINGKSSQETFDNPVGAHEFGDLVDRVGGSAARQILDHRRAGDSTVPTLREWATTYLDPTSGILTGIDQASRDGYATAAAHFLDRLGDMPLDAITRDHVGSWVQWQLAQKWQGPKSKGQPKPYSSSTVRNMHSVLSNMLRAALERDIISRNVARGVKIKDTSMHEPVFLSRDEFSALHDQMHDHYKPFLRFLVGTQVRFHEAAALTWAQVNDDSNPITVRIIATVKSGGKKQPKVIGVPKTKKGRRTIAIWPELRAELGPRGNPDNYVFATLRGARILHANFISRYWGPAVDAAGLNPAPTPHDLRHTGASWLIADGVPLTFIQARLGHASIKTTSDTYGHLLPDAHTRMAGSLQRILEPVPVLGVADESSER